MGIIQMSFSASVLIVAIVIIRAIALHRLPKKTFIFLWGVVVFRLLVPFSIPFRFSFYTGLDMLKGLFEEKTIISSMMGTTGILLNMPYTGGSVEADGSAITSIAQIKIVWLAGMSACVLFFIVVYIKYHREFRMSLPAPNGFVTSWLQEHPLFRTVQIRQSDRINAPLTYGIFRPVILFPKKTDWTDETKLQYILAHEFTHILHFDTLTKIVLTVSVCVHWFNPFVWLMYMLANRDIELTCDETVVRAFGETIKSAYALTLIGLEEKKSYITPFANNFSKNAIEERIMAIMKMKKLTVLMVVIATTLVVAVTTSFATTGVITPFSQNTTITTTGSTITPSLVSNGTHFDVNLIKGGTLIMGREIWNKGDEIIFNIISDKNIELNVGILPAENMDEGFGYNDYGIFIPKKIKAKSETQKIVFIVPETGEYGIGINHIYDADNEVGTITSRIPESIALQIGDGNDEKSSMRHNIDPNSMLSFSIAVNKVFENPLIK